MPPEQEAKYVEKLRGKVDIILSSANRLWGEWNEWCCGVEE